MKKFIAIIILLALTIPNVALAESDEYATLVWEGTVSNWGYSQRYRITLTGVIGEQVTPEKVKTYLKTEEYTNKRNIIPIVDGGSIKVEFLGSEDDIHLRDTDITVGYTCIYNYGKKYSSDKEKSIYVYGTIKEEDFFVNKEFDLYVDANNPEDFSELKLNHLKGKKYVARIYLPTTANTVEKTYIQIVSKAEAKKLMNEVKNGSKTTLLGKTFNDKMPDDLYYPKLKDVNKSELEKKYGLNISIAKGFLPEQVALRMIDKVYGNFPEGLIKEITSYYKSKGINTNVKFTYKDTELGGLFSDNRNSNTLYYYPSSIAQKFGDWVIAHEMGHYVHKYLNEKYGYDKLKSEWTSLNDNFDYKNEWTEKHEQYFVRDYSLTSYSEDFATIFELLPYQNNYKLRKDYAKNPNKPLYKKIDLLSKAILKSSNSVVNTDNLWGVIVPQEVSNHCANTYIELDKLGLIPDDERYFALYQKKITREDFALLIVNLVENLSGKSIEEYCREKNVDVDYYYYGTLSTPLSKNGAQGQTRSNYPYYDIEDQRIFNLKNLKIMGGVGNRLFDPNSLITREQTAAILLNVAKALDFEISSQTMSFTDSSEIASWFKSSVSFVTSNNIMNGYNNKFNPKDNLSYEQAYIIMYNFATKMQ